MSAALPSTPELSNRETIAPVKERAAPRFVFVHIGDENNLDWLPTPAKR